MTVRRPWWLCCVTLLALVVSAPVTARAAVPPHAPDDTPGHWHTLNHQGGAALLNDDGPCDAEVFRPALPGVLAAGLLDAPRPAWVLERTLSRTARAAPHTLVALHCLLTI